MPFTQRHALLIGVTTYHHEPKLNVSVTAAEARAVASALRNQRNSLGEQPCPAK
jgi:hypothetical protein